MILTKLHIENFGKLHNVEIDLKDNFNQLLQDNGWGKSTLTIFIKSIFYGMPAKTRGEDYKSERSRYSPWQGGVYGGYIEYKVDQNLYRLTRIFGKTPESDQFELLNYQDNTVVTEEPMPIGEKLFGIGEESFKMTAFFPQLNIKSGTNAELTANLTGLNKYQNDLENIDKAIKKLNEKRLDIKRNIPKKSELEENRNRLAEINNLRNSLLSEIEEEENIQKELDKELSFISQNIEFEKEKINLQDEKYRNKMLIENKVQEFTSKLNQIYSKQNELQKQTIETLNTKKPVNTFKNLLIALFVFLAVISTASLVLYVTNIFSLATFLAVLIVSILLIVVLIFLYLKKFKNKKGYAKLEDEQKLIKEFKDKIKSIEEDLKRLNEVLEGEYKDVDYPDREKLELLLSKETSVKTEYLSIKNKLQQLRNRLDENISAEDYLSSIIEKTKLNIKEGESKYKIVESTINYLLQAKDNVSSRFVSAINEEFFNILNSFNIPSNRFIIDNQWQVKEKTNVGTKEFEYSSQGIQDIISFCQRISLINKIYKKEKPFIILDDTFVNLDDKMLKCAKEIVNQISTKYQVIYICCNSRCSLIN